MGRISSLTAALACVVILEGCDMAQKGAMQWAYSDIENGKYESALQNLSSAESYVKPAPELQAEILYLRAVCYIEMERYDEAVGVLAYIIDKFPDSSYAYQAKAKLLLKVSPSEEETPVPAEKEPEAEDKTI